MAMLHLLCGKAASGKSTLAARLAAEPGTLLIAEDYWTSRLWPEELKTLADYSRYSRRLRSAMGGHVVELLKTGVSVVLDFPANTPAFREWMREIIERSGVEHRLHFLDVSNDECKARLHRRNASGRHEFTVSDEEFDQITSHFVPPAESERFNVVIYPGGYSATTPSIRFSS